MVSHPSRSSQSHQHQQQQSRPSQHTPSTSTTNLAPQAKRPSSAASSHSRAPSRDGRPSREGSAQRAAQDVAGLKDYQLGDCLGKGAFGSVYRALNWGTGETVAIKQVRMENLGAAELKNIMLEIDLLKNLNHPNIVKYHGFVKGTESLYIILEYCENGSLHSICKNFGKFPENLVSLYMSQVLQGLLYLHEQGVIHRDIKGANILTTKEGLVKLADFGVATKATGLDQSSVVGTPYWMAPEVIELSGATTSSDIWSVGCTVIELIEGKPPYHKLQPMQALFRIVNDEHPPIPGSVSPLLRDFLMECFQKNPTLRIAAKRLLKHPWIQSAKRTVPAVPTKPTEYTEAVKSVQEWNEALRSPNSLRRGGYAAQAQKKSPQPGLSGAFVPQKPPTNLDLNTQKHKSFPDSFRSPDAETNDRWDDDFADTISSRALNFPRLKSQDHFAGMFSHDKIKAFASFEAVTEEPYHLDGEETVKSPSGLQRCLQSGSLRTAETAAQSSSRAKPFSGLQPQSPPEPSHDGPKTAILRGVPQSSPSLRTKVAELSRPSTLYREDSVEDYTDLMPEDEDAFAMRIQAMQGSQPRSILPNRGLGKISSPAEPFSPRLFHPSDLKSAPRSIKDGKMTGSVRQRSGSSTSTRKPIQRSQSEIEIQKYAEDDYDDFSDVWGDIGKPAAAESDSGSEHSSMAMVTSKMSSFVLAEDDEIDPFANLDEGLENIDLENNVARDRDDRLAKQTESLVGCLKTSQPDDELLDIADQLIQVLYESPDKKNIVLRSHGLLPILEILGTVPPNDVVLPLLKIVNMLILEDAEAQESLSFLGGIPIVCNYAYKRYPSEIRKEAAAFVRQMYQTSTLTLQMFIGCGGINVLVEFLEEDIDAERDLVLIGVNGIWSIFELQGPTPKNDFCRILSRSSVLYPLSLVLNRVVDETGELAELIEGRIVNIFLIFSQAESHVKDLVADRMILKRVLKDLRKMLPNHQVTMLKFIKNLSMLSSTHEALQNSNAIDILIELLKDSKRHPLEREIANQILNTMYNLCRHNKSRQEEAALSDVIPLLKDVVQQGGPLKEFALPILCELAHSGKVARKMLWDAKGLAFYIGMLSDRNWLVTALDAISVWLQEETARVEQYLLHSHFSKAIVSSYTSRDLSQSSFENMLEPLQKIVRLSLPIAASLAVRETFTHTAQKLSSSRDAVTRLNLLRILRTICDATDDECTLIKSFNVYDTILHLSKDDPAILVRQVAEELVRSCDAASASGKRSASRASGFRRPLSNTGGVRAGSGSSAGSGASGHLAAAMTPPTPTTSLKNAFLMPSSLALMSPIPSSPNRVSSPRDTPRERIARSQSSAGIWEMQQRNGADNKGDVSPRPGVLARASTAFPAIGGSPSLAVATPNARIRRPSRGEFGSGPGSVGASTSIGSPAPKGSRLPKARSGRFADVNAASAGSADKSRGAVRGVREAGRENAASGWRENVMARRESIGIAAGRRGSADIGGNEGLPPATPPLPRLQIARRRRDVSGEVASPGMAIGRRGSRGVE
ncbi:hypothetical protein M011DRAFT_482072 [Sporormia fimetaria CBS 119925]|uniref:non-specific serine/threonine protein kinase n=1 Tax=Sporormia fimetaria CBS 119925 TaxID=1340428 RepID=A0A6A6UWZ1_9PLEO|nr:hypothetical protein M011DRAFT_482072 [Sporormia fimetaria CBS 119925]